MYLMYNRVNWVPVAQDTALLRALEDTVTDLLSVTYELLTAGTMKNGM
jgi:hypothetical protein